MIRLGVARLWHEGNSFSAVPTARTAFLQREWIRGDGAADFYRGTATELGAAVAFAEARDDLEIVFSRCAAAPPGGPLEPGLAEAIVTEISNDCALSEVCGLYLSLHGACVADEMDDPEGELLKRLRARLPHLPIVASFDLHANLSEAAVDCLDAATVYRTYPHVDMHEAGRRALRLLTTMVETGQRHHVKLVKSGQVLPSFNMRTDTPGPMAELQDLARARENDHPDVIAAYPVGGFAYADVTCAGAAGMVTATSAETAHREARVIADCITERKAAFRPALRDAATVMAARPWGDGRRLAILEPSDNPLSGGIGDTPGLLRSALEYGVPPGTVYAFFHDPVLVRTACSAGIGADLDVSLGGRLDHRFGAPVTGPARVERVTDGRFVNCGPMEHGLPVNLGRTCVISLGDMRVIVTEGCQSPNDPAFFVLHGIDIRSVPLLLAKAKNHFMAAFTDSFDAIEQVDTPGPAMADTSRLPFKVVPPSMLSLA